MKSSIIVQNLKCNGCANTITNSLSSLPNISEIEVDVEESKISFNTIYDEDALMVLLFIKKYTLTLIKFKNINKHQILWKII